MKFKAKRGEVHDDRFYIYQDDKLLTTFEAVDILNQLYKFKEENNKNNQTLVQHLAIENEILRCRLELYHSLLELLLKQCGGE